MCVWEIQQKWCTGTSSGAIGKGNYQKNIQKTIWKVPIGNVDCGSLSAGTPEGAYALLEYFQELETLFPGTTWAMFAIFLRVKCVVFFAISTVSSRWFWLHRCTGGVEKQKRLIDAGGSRSWLRTLEELTTLCHKKGLPIDSWKKGDAKTYRKSSKKETKHAKHVTPIILQGGHTDDGSSDFERTPQVIGFLGAAASGRIGDGVLEAQRP